MQPSLNLLELSAEMITSFNDDGNKNIMIYISVKSN